MSLVTCHLSFATCHLSLVTCHLPLVTCHLSLATCHLPLVTYHLSLVTSMYQDFAIFLVYQLMNLTSPRGAFAPKNQHKQNVSFLWGHIVTHQKIITPCTMLLINTDYYIWPRLWQTCNIQYTAVYSCIQPYTAKTLDV